MSKIERCGAHESNKLPAQATLGSVDGKIHEVFSGLTDDGIDVTDKSVRFRIPRDGFDVPILAVQEPANGRKPMQQRTALSDVIKVFLVEKGLRYIPKNQPCYVEGAFDDPLFAKAVRQFALEMNAKFGLAIVGGNALTFCEVEGKKFRVLNVPDTLSGIVSAELEVEINKIFIPSRIVNLKCGRFLLMPILEFMEHIDRIDELELTDFLSRFDSCRIVPSLDLGTNIDLQTNRPYPESNVIRHEGKLYLSDAGDVLHGIWDGKDRAYMRSMAQEELGKRVGTRAIHP